MTRKRMRWESWGTLDGEPRRDGGRQCEPHPKWRCRVWSTVEMRDVDHPTLVPLRVWNWEARTFGRGALHVSGEARSEKLCRIVALAAVDAIVKAGRAARR